MHTPEPHIVIQRFTEAHLEGVAALYNEPAVCRQVLQMPYQSADLWRKRIATATARPSTRISNGASTATSSTVTSRPAAVSRSIGMAVCVMDNGLGASRNAGSLR